MQDIHSDEFIPYVMHQSMCSPIPTLADRPQNKNGLSESPHWVRKVLSDPVGGATVFML